MNCRGLQDSHNGVVLSSGLFKIIINSNAMLRNVLFSITLTLIGITQTRSQLIEVEYKEFFSGCKFKPEYEEMVINSRDDLWDFSNCIAFNFNFNKYTIIIVQYKYPYHCQQIEEFNIFKDERNKRFIIETFISNGGRCYCKIRQPYYTKAVYIPKVENDYQFIFTTGLIYNKNLCCPTPKPDPWPPHISRDIIELVETVCSPTPSRFPIK